jgi:peptide/nickel transport system permease protein
MRYLTRRLAFYMVAAFVAISINFFLPRMMSGDPASIMFARFQGRAEPEVLDALRETFGFTEGPIMEQYASYLGHLAQGDLGLSVSRYPLPVSTAVQASLLWTIRLIGLATIMAFTLGIGLGIFAAWRRGKFVDTFVLPVASIMGAFPYFWLAMLAVYYMAFVADWFPINQAYDTALKRDWGDSKYVMSVIEHALLPMATIVVTGFGGWMLGMRNNMIGILSEDFIIMAQAKGLADRRVMFTYAARNAILPSLTGFAMSIGFLIGGALVVEIVFGYPGMGLVLFQAIEARDYPLMQGVFLMITLSVLVANFIADIMYVLLDPRAR